MLALLVISVIGDRVCISWHFLKNVCGNGYDEPKLYNQIKSSLNKQTDISAIGLGSYHSKAIIALLLSGFFHIINPLAAPGQRGGRHVWAATRQFEGWLSRPDGSLASTICCCCGLPGRGGFFCLCVFLLLWGGEISCKWTTTTPRLQLMKS